MDGETAFRRKYGEYVSIINNALDDCVPTDDKPGSEICNAMKYSLAAGGKRLRPVLALAVCDMLRGSRNDVLPYACAIEMIHTYSLIHDDLPAMDNDDYRRGMPSNHRVFGEAMAILAGDALLNRAYEVMVSHIMRKEEDLSAYVRAMHVIAAGAGVEGMIRGQTLDISYQGLGLSEETLEYMHRCKTGALIRAAVLAGACIGRASEAEYKALDQYAENIGLAFQIKDDIMDVEGSLDRMGKMTGKDAASGKNTYVSVYGLEKAAQLLDRSVSAAVEALECFGEEAGFLRDLALFIRDRDN
ncbi:MAG TPA: polyprenyl synthetase family protein [Clostridiales bacterium]|nr:polyprenyl synthetase family protein [Clostridiales bacterium]HPV01886.1 polyprenyl synthetase family protein [Clostridiales bacterium]